MRYMYPFELDSFRIAFARWQVDADAENAARWPEVEQPKTQLSMLSKLIGKIRLHAVKRLGIGVSGLLR